MNIFRALFSSKMPEKSESPARGPTPVKPTGPSALSGLTRKLEAEVKQREALEGQVGALRKRVAELENQHKAVVNAKNTRLLRRKFVEDFCSSDLVMLNSKIPEPMREKTIRVAHRALKLTPSTYDALCEGEQLKGGQRWALYWVLANAARDAAKVTATRSEDGGSTEFSIQMEKLASSCKEKGLLGSNTRISVQRIYENRSVALQEKEVGADLLLVIVGETLIGKPGFRLFWLQAKRPDTTTFKLNYWRKTENDGGLRQVSALAAVHHPEKGSFGVYMQYLQELTSTYALTVDKIPVPFGKSEAECVVYLKTDGLRAQELLWLLATDDSTGVFDNADAVAGFLSTQATIPGIILALTPETDELALDLVKQLDERLQPAEVTNRNPLPPAPGCGPG